jgi:hypothetical protein
MTALVHPRQTYYRCSRGSARTRPCRSRYINAKRVDRDLERLYRSLPFPATVRRELETKLRLAALDEERLHLGASTAAGGPEPCAGARDAVGGPVRRRPAGLRCVPPCSDRLAEQRVQLEQELKGLQSPGADPSLRNCQSVWEVHRRLEHRQQVQLTHRTSFWADLRAWCLCGLGSGLRAQGSGLRAQGSGTRKHESRA